MPRNTASPDKPLLARFYAADGYANDNIVRIYRPRRRGQWALVRATVLDWLASWMFGAAQLCRVAALTLSRWAMR